MSVFCTIDDKHVFLSRIIWVSAVPHFCGDEDCQREGLYQVCLECDETLWATREERDAALAAVERWMEGDSSDTECEE